MSKFELKNNVNIIGVHPLMLKVFKSAAEVWENNGRVLVITSCMDGLHSPGSYHYIGCAVDLRTYYFPNNTIPIVAAELSAKLGIDYEVIVEKTHIHVELAKIPQEFGIV